MLLAAGGGMVLSSMLASCGSSGASAAPAGSMSELASGSRTYSLLSSVTAVNPGVNRFAFDLASTLGQILTGGRPEVWIAEDKQSRAIGPATASWYGLTAYGRTGDRSPRTNIPGLFDVSLNLPSAGDWYVLARAVGAGLHVAAMGAIPVVTGHVPAALGSPAVSVPTPTSTTEQGLGEICTRQPPCHMHAISLDRALRRGRPTIVVFSTPLLCQSRFCAPVTDEVILTSSQIARHRASFIHVEIYLPGKALRPPAPTAANRAPAVKAWGFETEPWTIVIDRHGIVRNRFEGPVAAPLLEAAVQPLLG
ncbi:MAG TPA: hypothetical protein VMS22_20135 [Candidatus Eisenbacteria bacterium]|nr:hypothetical protein [Candidatus Eisenbacteria bacterium]